jgi:uncharacterized membrane protein YheB (UPF0754 family)
MLFRPYKSVKVFGITIWPQGMIPRHRARLAETIGNAVGNELVSQETVLNALFEADFFRRKVEGFVGSYARDLLETDYPSFLDALPSSARAPVLDAITSLQYRMAEYIAETLRSEETAAAIGAFVDKRIDELLSRRVSDTIGEAAFDEILRFLEGRFRRLVTEDGFRRTVRRFTSERLDELANSQSTLADLLTASSVALIKERVDEQVPPIVHHLAELATSKSTRTHIGALIKREVDDYYAQLSFFKKIFVSRDRIHQEVDDMVSKTLPKRIEEYLQGPAFAQEAEGFLNSTIDGVMARPINEIVGNVAPEKLDAIKDQIARRVVVLAQSPDLQNTVSAYLSDAMERLKPHTMRALLLRLSPESAPRLKGFLSKGLLSVLARPETAKSINGILSAQIERLLVTPIGRLGDHLSTTTIESASIALAERITAAARERLPGAIAEFDIGGIVKKKVSEYPLPKLESLVMSVAQQHLKTIEWFGAAIGFMIGVAQGLYIVGVP